MQIKGHHIVSVYCIMLTIFVLGPTKLQAQDLSQFKKAKPVVASGSFNANANYIQNEHSNIDPFGYNASLNLNFRIYNNFSIPVNFSYGSYGSSFNTLSIKRFGFSPSYKSLKIHAGYRSYQLSPYIMNGVTLVGGGIELTPKNFYFLVFHGNMADRYNLGGEFLQFRDENIEFYKRRTSGMKLGFGKTTSRVSLMMFHAEDNQFSGTLDSLRKYNVKPKENFVIGSDLNLQLFKFISIQANAAASIFTNDVNGKAIDGTDRQEEWINHLSFITTVNTASRYAFAYDGQISFRIRSIQLGLKYQHVDPFYTSLGLAFIQTNYNNYLATLNGSLFKNKLIVFSNVGFQYSNVEGYTGVPQKRIVQTTNVNWKVSNAVSYSINYTNMNQNTNFNVEEVHDSLRLTTNMQGWNTGITYRFGSGKIKPHQLNASFANNTFEVINNDETTTGNRTQNAILGYRYSVKEKWSVGTSLNYNNFDLPDAKQAQRYGLLLNYAKYFGKKLNIRFQTGYKINNTNQISDGYVLNGGINLLWKPTQKHNFNLSTSALSRKTNIQAPKNEMRYRLGYFINF